MSKTDNNHLDDQKKQNEFSVIIPTYNDWNRLGLCVKSLLEGNNDFINYEIIVVDNDNNHQPPDTISQMEKIRLIHEPQPGSYAARNKGSQVASGRYLAFTDSDCIPDKNWLKNAMTAYSKFESDLIGGKINIFKETSGSKWAYIYDKNTAFPQRTDVQNRHSVTANLFVKKKVFIKLGGFDSTLKSGGDWEFTERAVRSGYTLIYSDNVIINHPARTSIKAILKKERRFAAWGYLKVKQRFGYSGFRILCGNIFYGIKNIYKIKIKTIKFNHKLIIILISVIIYLYRIYIQLLIIIGILRPKNIRE